MPLVQSEDYGREEAGVKSLLQRHTRLEEEVRAYSDDIARLQELATLMTKAANAHNVSHLEIQIVFDV